MKNFTLVLFLICAQLSFGKRIFPNFYGTIESRPIKGDPGEPLLLTPLIEQNRIAEAQNAAQVNYGGFGSVKSYSGYLTVSNAFNSNLFFWYFPAFNNDENAPVILWLQGGPGATSMFGLFQENGPFKLTDGETIKMRTTTWAKTHSVIYIDNPVGTGFSFTNGGYAENQTKVGDDLYNALQQFFTLFPNIRKNRFYITGESYAGKYIPAISYTILKRNPSAPLKINLQGMAIGNGLSDPIHQFFYGERLFELGLIDSNTKAKFEVYENQVVQLIQQENYEEAMKVLDLMINGGESSLFWSATGYDNVYNLLLNVDTDGGLQDGYLEQFISIGDVRKAIHVGNTPFGDYKVGELLSNDVPKSVAPWISELLSNYKVVIYNGQLDLLVPYPQTVNFLENLSFSSAAEYKTAERSKWYVQDELAGYIKQAGNLTEMLVRNAGHMVPSDQPEWAEDLIKRLTAA